MKLYITLTTEQGTVYEAVVKEVLERIERADEEGNNVSRHGLVLSLMMRLKQIFNPPTQYMPVFKHGKSILSGLTMGYGFIVQQR